MLTITICVGSSCYVRGSDKIAETLERLIQKEAVAAKVELRGSFCMEHCSMGVTVQVGDRVFCQIGPESAERFFYDEVMPSVEQPA